MEPKRYFEQIQRGLALRFGQPRQTRNGLCYGNIAVEYECVGPTMIVFLSTLNWMHNTVWDGAVHIDLHTVSPDAAVLEVQKMMELGKARVNYLLHQSEYSR